jgi:hypothetical protein
MAKIVVDVEADGPCPGLYSMVSFGAVYVSDDGVQDSFYGRTKPLPGAGWIPQALAVSKVSREEHLNFKDPVDTMINFEAWLLDKKAHSKSKRLFFISDNNGFDWQFINYYFWLTIKYNPFGHSSNNLNDLYKGMVKDVFKNFKHLRDTKHTHHPVDDATGNAEALYKMVNQLGLRMKL